MPYLSSLGCRRRELDALCRCMLELFCTNGSHECNHGCWGGAARDCSAAAMHSALHALLLCHSDASISHCRRTFPNEEMDVLATAVRQVARMLWSIHVCLQMGFEDEVTIRSKQAKISSECTWSQCSCPVLFLCLTLASSSDSMDIQLCALCITSSEVTV